MPTRYRKAIEEKRALTGMLRGKNYDKAVRAGVGVMVRGPVKVDEHFKTSVSHIWAMGAVPKAHVLRRPVDMLKTVVDADTDRIRGAHFFCVESQDMINRIKSAMDAGLAYTTLRDVIYTHPTMSKALNDLFATI